MYTRPLSLLSAFSLIITLILFSSCDTVSTEEDGAPSPEELESQVEEVMGRQVTELHVRKIDVGTIAEELENGETTIPFAAPESLRTVDFGSQQVDLRSEEVTTGVLRQGPDSTEEVPLPPEQSYLLGDRETSFRLGGLTILDDDQTMLQGLTRVSDFGISYVQPVNQVLDTDQYPDYHVFYNVANTEEFDLGGEDVFTAEEEGASSKGAKLDVNETTGVVLDGDVEFYNQDPSTVWHRQECLFFMTQLANAFIEPVTSDEWRLDLQIAGQEVWVSGGPSTTDPRQLMNRLTDPNYFLLNSLDRDELHLFLTGYNVSGLAGMAAGIGRPSGGWGGGAGNNHAFSEVLPRRSLHINQAVLAHEAGHLIGGHHGNAIQGGCSGTICGRSLMNHIITPQTEYFYSDANDGEIQEVVDAVLP